MKLMSNFVRCWFEEKTDQLRNERLWGKNVSLTNIAHILND